MRPDHRVAATDESQGACHHLVVKRGHRGRYRFVMIADGERIGGEVWIDAPPRDSEAAHGIALARITRLADALRAAVATRAARAGPWMRRWVRTTDPQWLTSPRSGSRPSSAWETSMARYEKARKGETRRHIVDLASKRFRADGIDGVGIASLMADAGLTNGGFYAHFASKEDLVKEAIVHALAEMPGEPARTLAEDAHDLPAFIDRYLSTAHRKNPSAGCAVAALSPELARRPSASRAAFQKEGMATIERIASGLPDTVEAAERLPRAMAVFSHLVGTLQMARFVQEEALSAAILSRGKIEARRIAGL